MLEGLSGMLARNLISGDTMWKEVLKAKATATHNSKGEKKDRCARIADRPSKYGPKGSAYKSGAIVQCRQGKIWRDEK